ncbi:MAG TPA: dephospho-CoA kinase [Dehalococcoidia bacterium]|nr:dephospho-CoA kinase [Dehalococcoidia bacterium]
MAGSGKSEVTRVFKEHGYTKIRFGDLTDEEIKKRGLDINEANERSIRQELRNTHGMAAYAILNMPRIETLLKSSDVVIDGLYSWEEYTALKSRYGGNIHILAVWASPRTRYERLRHRQIRPLTKEEAAGRDKAEIENINKGGPIAMADFTILNDTDLKELRTATEKVIMAIAGGNNATEYR